MDMLCSSDQFRLIPRNAPYFREELSISPADASHLGLDHKGQFGIFCLEPLYPGPPEVRFAVSIGIDANVETGTVDANQHFLDYIGFRMEEDRFWSVRMAAIVVPLQEVVVELAVEPENIAQEIQILRNKKNHLLVHRCLLVEPGCTVKSLALPVLGQAYFNVYSIQPAIEKPRENTVLIIDEKTIFNLFVPHRRGGVDMVVVVDVSTSMDLRDYVGADNRPHPRLEGVRIALEGLFQRKLVAGSRVSRIAAIVFGENTQMLYPPQEATMVEIRSEAQIEEIRACMRNLTPAGLQRLHVERTLSDISRGLQYAAELLDYYSREGNERVIILLSDGADWVDEIDGASEGQVVTTAHEPAILADTLHFDSQIRIHTVAISNKRNLRKHVNQKYWDEGWAVPNPKLLKKIADFTEGIFFDRPDAQALAKLFDEIGEGTIYPIN